MGRSLLGSVSLRASLAIILAVIIVLLFADRGREVMEQRELQVAEAKADLWQLATAGAERQTDIITEAQALLRLAAALPESAPSAGLSCRPIYKRLTGEVPWLTSITSFNLLGKPICSSTDPLPKTDVSDRAYFQEVLSTQAFTISDYVVSRVTGKPVLIAAMPRAERDAVEAVLVAAIDVDWLSRLTAMTKGAAGTSVLLLDRVGTVVAASPDPGMLVGTNIGHTNLFRTLSATSQGVDEASGLDSLPWIVAHQRLTRSSATVAVMQPKHMVLADANRQAIYDLGKIAAVAVVVFLVIWVGGDRMVLRPLDRLVAGAQRFGRGELSQPLTMSGVAPELQALGSALNAMAGHLAERDAELRRANEALQQLASTDPLTGLANRRSFEEALQSEWNRATREFRYVAAIAIDIDNFKKFNDRFGHPAGDACLRAVSGALSGRVKRSGELVARIGGEEFAVLLPGLTLEEAARFADILRREIAALGIEHPDNVTGRVTASLGVAALKSLRGDQPGLLMGTADQALYRAKANGRNQVARADRALSLAS